jgi:hypothetical protein
MHSKDIIQYSSDLFHADAPDDILLMMRKTKTVSTGGVSMLTRKVIATLVASRDKKWAAVCYKEQCLYSRRGRTESPPLTSKQTRSDPGLTDDGRENKLAVRPENKLAVRPGACHSCQLPRLTAEPSSN